ncbi:glycyl-tRNA synthetase beta chain [Polynucleobacter sphagniphilus]|jgi:glycyl-tRNA synthetase beta chain|uniref:Glycine--tRNA ligase beta subunit n=1 Tax=Polynucleobacter sphagniphilus TaxID=1743169 RepID=A0AA43S406_9BURK|nr:glycine--tRNA ligase subunit beta [Polynucleobacter sphagniphilus]MDH6250165.1 glycyl-tRNA synthetase beta chain [Polynucleobacter sphagniphilus]MDH6299723.1 glycyl-tRNA synthetase beta chain [Polynucleobacter sphagniphilus]MDH6303191.1 glycyl-tRNA synthetase beta chain [Polynucleobacter sphagniphilus]MDH6502915.1 glycyl-tRNA synthetase beta chain [Polynucleobacter sphagniphilus]MDH6511576.1 glycyl-tRNA synthetase beta chain [Polynucleobacter sphagniphilus]
MSTPNTLSPSANLLIEVFTEELPPKSLRRLGDAFSEGIFSHLKHAGLAGDDSIVTSYATPRRLAVHISHVLSQAPDYPVREKLLPTSIAFDADGKPTAPLLKKLSALGYADIDIATLEKSGEGKNEALYLNITAKGASLQDLAQTALIQTLNKLPIAKMMHYQVLQKNGALADVQFARPAHRIIALHGNHSLNISALGINASNQTEGHRFLAPGVITIASADQYESALQADAKILPSFNKRRQFIETALLKAAGDDLVLMPDSLLDEVTALVEWPAIYECHFDNEFLEVPQECLILTMQTNQKYFALTDKQGKLRNRFLIVSNIQTDKPAAIISGNERVVRPRLSDARFFFQQDQKRTLAARVADLGKVVYHNQLGNQLDRTLRVQAIASGIATQLGVDDKLANRAAEIAKTDLLTDMVGEFPELQGIMGRYYATHDGEDTEVASACSEHYMPRFAGDALPTTQTGSILAIADKLETLVGIWGVGLAPTGDKDPYALRRHALGICRLLLEKNLALHLPKLIELAKAQFPQKDVQEKAKAEDIYVFILDRLRAYLKDQSVGGKPFTSAEIDAVLSQSPTQLNDLIDRLTALREFNALTEASQLAAANKRISNILKKTTTAIPAMCSKALLHNPAEIALYQALENISPALSLAYEQRQFVELLKALVALSQPIDQFFADVMVMDPNPELRDNRLALLQQLHQKMNLIADLGKLA